MKALGVTLLTPLTVLGLASLGLAPGLIGDAEARSKSICDSWLTASDELKSQVLSGDATIPENVYLSEFDSPSVIKNAEDRTFVDKMVAYLDKHSEEYNPDFPFKKQNPSFASIRLVHEVATGKLLGGYVYIVRELTEDAGKAWINGYFEAPLRYMGRGQDADDPLTWSHY
jgi:hypothetical protein